MTNEEKRALPACAQLDRIVTAYLWGWGRRRSGHRHWSRDPRAALDLLHELLHAPYYTITHVTLTCKPDGDGPGSYWECTFDATDMTQEWECEGEGETMPLAFCRALIQEREEDNGGL